MVKKLMIFFSMAVMLVMAAGCGPNSAVQVNTPGSEVKAGTPTPSGEITVPGVTIQLYVPGPNPLINTPDSHGRPANILLGIWHGIISPITLIVSFINPNVQMYEVHTNGSQYSLGFLIGIAIVFILLGAGLGSRRRR